MCSNKLAVLAFALLAAVPAFAQRTVVTGTVTDTAGLPYSQASLTVTLSLPTGAVGAYLGGAQIAGTAGPFKLDNNGSFLVQLPDNTLIQCANAAGQLVACAPQTTWLFTFTTPGIAPPVGTGPQTFSSTQTISGASQTLTISNGPRQTSAGLVSFPLLAPNGLVTAPSYSFSSNPGTGMYSTGGNNLSLAVNGTEEFRTNGLIAIFDTSITVSGSYSISSNCASSASPAVCGGGSMGAVVIAAGATTVQVNTTAVTANSEILLQEDDSLGARLSVTCNTTSLGATKISARVAGTSFTITTAVAPTTNPACLNFVIFN